MLHIVSELPRPAGPMGVEIGDGARRVWGYLATGNYFDVLGVKPAHGRFFHPEGDRQPGASPYAVLSHACWQSRFAADPLIVGRTSRINALSYTVVGVAPAGFRGTELFYQPEIWVPMMMRPQIEGRSWLDNRNTFNSMLIGRLKAGVTPPQAEANLNVIASALAAEHPASNEGMKLRLARPGLAGDTVRAPAEAFIAGVMTLAGLVLLAACANLASLLAAAAPTVIVSSPSACRSAPDADGSSGSYSPRRFCYRCWGAPPVAAWLPLPYGVWAT